VIALDESSAWIPTGYYGVENVALPGADATEDAPMVLALHEKSVDWRSIPVHSGLIVDAGAEDFVGALTPGQLWRFRPGGQMLSLDQWMTLHFGDDSNPGADPDTDGLPNLVEFGFGTDPSSALSQAHPALRLSEDPDSGEAICEVSFVRNPFANGIYFQLESSTDLENWESVPGARIEPADSPANPLLRFNLGEEGGNAQGFLRVTVGVEP
jgi:hypothetical protein